MPRLAAADEIRRTEARFGMVSIDDMKNRRDQLRKMVTRCTEVIMTQEALRVIEAVEIDGATKFDTAMEMTERYFENVERAVLKRAMNR